MYLKYLGPACTLYRNFAERGMSFELSYCVIGLCSEMYFIVSGYYTGLQSFMGMCISECPVITLGSDLYVGLLGEILHRKSISAESTTNHTSTDIFTPKSILDNIVVFPPMAR